MEPAGLALGVIGIFGVCVDLLEKYEVYRDAKNSQRQVFARLQAEKIRLKLWGDAVGCMSSGVREKHDERLDDPDTYQGICHLLICLGDILDSSDDRVTKLRVAFTHNATGTAFETKSGHWGASRKDKIDIPFSRRGGVAWAFGRRERLTESVDNVKLLVDLLHQLIPPRNESFDARETQDLQLQSLAQEEPKEASLLSSMGKELDRLVREVSASRSREELKAIESWLGVDASNERYEELTDARLEGTCDWIRDTAGYKDWLAGKPGEYASRFLWIYGPAGFGKTILCSRIIDFLKRDQENHVAYSFSVSSQSQASPELAVRQWLLQMACEDAGTRDEILSRLSSWGTTVASSSAIWTMLETTMSTDRRPVFVVDGLDEYDQGNASLRTFLQKLKFAVEKSQCRVLVVSREIVDIKQELSPKTNNASNVILFEHKITEKDISADISSFARTLVKQKLPDRTESFQTNLAASMASRCQGMFLWLKLQQSQLRARKTQKALQHAIARTPTGLTMTYESSRLLINSHSSEDQFRAGSILTWVIYSFRPLNIVELAEALEHEQSIDCSTLSDDASGFALSSDGERKIDEVFIDEEITGLCGNLLEVRDSGGPHAPGNRVVRLAHFTVREYLLSLPQNIEAGCKSWVRLLEPTAAHTHLAKTCIRNLLTSEFRIQRREDLNTRQDVPKNDFCEYSSSWWYKHLQMGTSDDPELLSLVGTFLSPSNPAFDSWRRRYEAEDSDQEGELDTPRELPSPMYYAAMFGLTNTMSTLREGARGDLHSPGGRYGSVLQAACAKGQREALILLLQWGANIDDGGGQYGSAINAASASGEEDMFARLADAGASLVLQDNNRRTALHHAAGSGNIQIVSRILRDLNIDRGTRNRAEDRRENVTGDKQGLSPRSQKQKEAKRIGNDGSGETPLYIASVKGYLEVVRLILAKCEEATMGNNDGRTPLHAAAERGHLEILRLLIDQNAVIGLPDKIGVRALLLAVQNGHVEAIKLLLDSGADATVANKDGLTPVHAAAQNGHIEALKLLLDRGGDATVANKDGWTPVLIAAQNGHVEAIKLLLDSGADATVASKDGWTPVLIAAQKSHIEALKLLLDRGGDATAANKNGLAPVYFAARSGHVQAIKLLLDSGANATVANKDGWTPVLIAAKNGHVEAIKLLFDSGADATVANKDGWTPVLIAAQNGHVEAIKLLLTRGGDATVANKDGWTPVYAAALNGHIEALKLLLDRGGDATVANKDGWTPVYAAALNGHIEALKLLLDRGGDATVANKNGSTPVYAAALNGHVEAIKLLLDRGGDATVANKNGSTPVYAAALNGHVEAIKLLLDRGGDATLVNKNGFTAVYVAAQNGHVEAIKLLLDSGADATVANKDGWTPVLIAAQNGHVEAIKLLLDSGADATVANKDGWTPVYAAALNGHIEALKLLLDRGGDASVANKNGSTPVYAAALNGHIGAIKLLVDSGADATVANKDGWTPVLIAAQNGHVEAIKLLLDTGKMALDSKDKYGVTPLSWAAGNGQEAVVKLLLDTGKVDVDSKDDDGRTPLLWAAENGHLQIVRNLITIGADTNLRDSHGWDLLTSALAGGHTTVAELVPGRDEWAVPAKSSTILRPSALVPASQPSNVVIHDAQPMVIAEKATSEELSRRFQIRADHPMVPCSATFYFEVTVVHCVRESLLGIGVCEAISRHVGMPGWAVRSWGYHSDDGMLFSESGRGKVYGETYQTGDVIGCGGNTRQKTLFFTKNGAHLGEAAKNIGGRVFAVIGIGTKDVKVKVNFGEQPFMYKA